MSHPGSEGDSPRARVRPRVIVSLAAHTGHNNHITTSATRPMHGVWGYKVYKWKEKPGGELRLLG